MSLGVLTAPAHATAPKDGFGFGIADDGGIGTLNTQYFDRLRPKSFRFMVPWDAALHPDALARADQIIWIARSHGVQQITVSFDHAYSGSEAAPDLTAYTNSVAAFIGRYANVVDAWGPANEPNCGGGWSGLNGTTGAQTTARMYQIVVWIIRSGGDPTARMLSPDFCDSYSAPGETATSISTWMNAYKAADGLFGDVIAWHPYWDIHYKGAARVHGPGGPLISSTQNLINNVNGNPIWVTEGGAFVSHPSRGIFNDQETQNDKVGWMVGTLAEHPRIQRLHYYSMFGNTGAFDTGLLWSDGTRRLAWYTWCWYSHNLNGFHPDCL